MATKQALQEARPAAAASARPQVDYGQFDIREQGLCWQLGDDMHSARTGASTGRQHDVREQEEDARAQFREHRARKGGEGSQAAPQAPQSPRKGAPSLPAELREEFGEGNVRARTEGKRRYAIYSAGR